MTKKFINKNLGDIFIGEKTISNTFDGEEILIRGITSGDILIQAPATVTSYSLTMPNAQGAADTYLKNDGSGNLTWEAASGGGGMNIVETDSTTTAANNTHYLTDTSSGGFTITLPSGSSGARIKFSDSSATWHTNNLTIQPASGESISIYPVDDPLIADTQFGWVDLIWSDSLSYWVLIS